MKYLAAYLLLATAGKTPSADGVKQLFSAAGIEADEERLSSLISSLEGKNVEEVRK
jgi:large subunit ribosomal protein LP2